MRPYRIAQLIGSLLLLQQTAYSQQWCEDGFVWREAGLTDFVCVTPASADRAAAENESSVEAQSCPPGLVWREAFAGDQRCVTPERRNAVLLENELTGSRAQAMLTDVPCMPGLVWRLATDLDYLCVSPTRRQTVFNENNSRNRTARSDGSGLCRPGLVWREAVRGDRVCVGTQRKAVVDAENAAPAAGRNGLIQPSRNDIDPNTRRSNATVRVSLGGCSGILVTPTVVVTSGHCMPNRPSREPNPYSAQNWEYPGKWYEMLPTATVTVGSNVRNGTGEQTFSVTHWSTPSHVDLMALRLSQPVPISLAIPADVVTYVNAPVRDDEATIRDWINSRVIKVAGWGVDERGQFPQFRKSALDFEFKRYPETSFETNYAQIGLASAGGAQVTGGGGDSGGPAYWLDGYTHRLIGVTQGSERFVATFFRGGDRPESGHDLPDVSLWFDSLLERERCSAVDAAELRVIEASRGNRWILQHRRPEGWEGLYGFGSQQSAERAMQIMIAQNVDQWCWDGVSMPDFHYFLSQGELPAADVEGENCAAIFDGFGIRRGQRLWSLISLGDDIPVADYPPFEGAGGTSRSVPYLRADYARGILARRQATQLCTIGGDLRYFKR